MKINILANALAFEGVLDEESSLKDLLAAFETVKANGFTPPLALSFAKVTRGNSAGIVTWLKFMKQIQTPVKYRDTPVWLVGQFNMIKGYFENSSYVESFQAPYYCENGQHSKVVTLVIGKDLPILDDYSRYVFPHLQIDGKEYEIDFDPAQFLSFIGENHASFRENLK